MRYYSEELYHHGIKGMRWGVRRYQNKDGSLTPAGKVRYAEVSDKQIRVNKDGSSTIPEGFVFNRVGKQTLDVNESGALYVSYGKEDAARYVKNLGPTPIGNLFGTSSHYVQHIGVNSDIKMPSDSDTVSLTIKAVKNNKKVLDSFRESIYSMTATDDPFADITDKDIDRALSNPKSKEAIRLAYSVNSMLGDPNYASESKMIYDLFRSNGYDAIPDIHDRLSGTSETAMIVINPDKLTVTSSQYITKDVRKAAKEYVKEIGKLKVSDILS